jgi:hypothetical protein
LAISAVAAGLSTLSTPARADEPKHGKAHAGSKETASAATASGSGKRLPPIGERRYMLDTGPRYAPVAIERAEGKSPAQRLFLKDPIQPSKDAKVVRPAPPPPKPKPVAKPKDKAGLLRFGKLSVNGHLMRPRVEFTREVLPLGRVDEPLPDDFYDKVFEPAKDDAF